MLSIYGRRSNDCPRNDDITWKRCRCSKWINGTLDGRFIRRTAKARSWEKAEELKQEWEKAATPKKIEPVTIEQATRQPRKKINELSLQIKNKSENFATQSDREGAVLTNKKAPRSRISRLQL